MVETEFSIVRFRGDTDRANREYKGLTPCKHGNSLRHYRIHMTDSNFIVTGDDIAEEIVWCASRPDHVQIAQMRKNPSPDSYFAP